MTIGRLSCNSTAVASSCEVNWKPKSPASASTGLLRLGNQRTDRSRQRVTQRAVPGRMQPGAGPVGCECIVAEIGDLGHITEDSRVLGKSRAHRRQQPGARAIHRVESLFDPGSVSRCRPELTAPTGSSRAQAMRSAHRGSPQHPPRYPHPRRSGPQASWGRYRYG